MNKNEKIRVLYLINDLGKGGAERYLIDLCTELSKREDIEFRVGALFDNNEYPQLTQKIPIENLSYNTFSLSRKNENILYKNLLESFRPHIIHTHRFLGEFISSYYLNENIKYICHCHDNMNQFNNFSLKIFLSKKKILQFIEKHYLILHKYNKIKTFFLANSTHTEQYFKKSLPRNTQHNVKLLYYGFNFHRFYDNTTKQIDTNKLVRILNIGSFADKKNQALIIAIANELQRRDIPFEINLIGDGKNFNKIQKMIIENNLENKIFLIGTINNVEDWYKTSDIYLHTALYEPFGLVFLEAMAAGLPVITLDGKGNRDIIQESKNGFIIDTQDPKAFANSIVSLIENSTLYSKISEYSKKFAKQFDTPVKTQELMDFYSLIMSPESNK